ncbi:nucleoside hydrolase [Christensenella timonensis]|uniref:nucleoside hydrolase n=1 Tax=Christensenella timonensis TaxID=1816678 RepID=UPI000834E4B9|nr:nucleoside hydrolase [Christensenella timonensis]
MQKILIDCDPGHDDAVALILATRARELDILGVTVVAGNSVLENTLRNALDVLAFADAADIPVYAGASSPLKRPLYNNSGVKIHGENGLGNQKIDVHAGKVQDMHAMDFIVQTLKGAEEKITLVCLGPLTNIAQAFLKDPACKENVEKIVIMGGAVYAPGNVNSAAEFNFFIDPEAAKIVINSGCRIYLNTLDITMKALFNKEEIERLEEHDRGKLSRLTGGLLWLYAGNYEEELGIFACPVHDAVCIGTLLRPELVGYEKVCMDVSTQGITAGESVVDFSGGWGRKENVWLGRSIDTREFVNMVTQATSQARGEFV